MLALVFQAPKAHGNSVRLFHPQIDLLGKPESPGRFSSFPSRFAKEASSHSCIYIYVIYVSYM